MPVFFESGLLILIPVAFGIARKTGKSVFCYSIPLLAGLAIGHAFVPPTPGPVLVAEMLKAGLMVMKIIYVHPKKITPKLVWFRTPLQTDRHKAMLSDSITLTAGTITVRSQDGRLLVHALDAPLAEGIEDTAFQQQLEKMEGTQWRR